MNIFVTLPKDFANQCFYQWLLAFRDLERLEQDPARSRLDLDLSLLLLCTPVYSDVLYRLGVGVNFGNIVQCTISIGGWGVNFGSKMLYSTLTI